MKKLLLVTALIFTTSAFSSVKVGIINVQKVLASIAEGKSVNSTLEKSFKSKENLIKTEEKEIRELQEKFKKQDAVLSAAAKAKKGAEIQQKYQAIRAKMMQFEKEIRKQEAELKKPIFEKLRPVIEAVSKAEKVSVTFEGAQSSLLYVENRVDMTDKFIKAYDKKYSK